MGPKQLTNLADAPQKCLGSSAHSGEVIVDHPLAGDVSEAP